MPGGQLADQFVPPDGTTPSAPAVNAPIDVLDLV